MTRAYIYKVCVTVSALLCALTVFSATYNGRVVDQNGQPVSYATIYPELQPEQGTATNLDGRFTFNTDLPKRSLVIISFVGYEKLSLSLAELERMTTQREALVLKEQPIALQEMVVAAKPSKQRNKRKQMAELLHAVYVKIQEEFPSEPAQYQVVSDVRMNSNNSTWGMEQMIANVVVLPEEVEGNSYFPNNKKSDVLNDSVQWQGRYCKRFFSAEKRAQADSILAGQTIERLEKKSKVPDGAPEHFMRKAVNSLDSGMIVHRSLFSMGNMRYDFEQAMNDTRHWTVSNESEGETVLTHTEKVNKYFGLFQLTFQRHYILDSKTYAVLRFSEHAEVKITIPFGYKLNQDQLEILNLLNMSGQQIEKFRLKKVRAKTDYNTFYQRKDGKLYILEKNLVSDAEIIGSKDIVIPVHVQGTQHVTDVQTKNVKPLTKSQINKRLTREIVNIY